MEPNETEDADVRRRGGEVMPSQRLERLRRRHGREPVSCPACRWQGDRSQCDLAPVHRAGGAYALPGAVWRGQTHEVCPACGGRAIEEAAWCPACAGWTCLCRPGGDEASENCPGP